MTSWPWVNFSSTSRSPAPSSWSCNFVRPRTSFLNKGAHDHALQHGAPFRHLQFHHGPGLLLLDGFPLFLLFGYIQARTYKIWLLAAVTGAVMIATACSGSRSCLVLIGLVVVTAIVCVVFRGKGGMGIVIAALLVTIRCRHSLGYNHLPGGQLTVNAPF